MRPRGRFRRENAGAGAWTGLASSFSGAQGLSAGEGWVISMIDRTPTGSRPEFGRGSSEGQNSETKSMPTTWRCAHVGAAGVRSLAPVHGPTSVSSFSGAQVVGGARA
jgi:hypothetical protein